MKRLHLYMAVGALPLLLLGAVRLAAQRPEYHHLTVYLRGKPQKLRVYEPAPGAPRRDVQVLVTSGDLGFLEISETVPLHLQQLGYRVIGVNAQTYIASFTGDDSVHVQPEQIARDYDVIMEAANVDERFPARFVSVGVSEGAGLAVMAMGQEGASALCDGVIALGLPVHTALGWRWADLLTEVLRREPPEPLADTQDYLARLRVPLVVAHSIHDEYDAIEHVRAMVDVAPVPRRFIPVDAPNHRFSHHSGEIFAIVASGIDWIESLRRAASAGR